MGEAAMLTLAYIVLAVIGCGYIVVSAFLGHLFEFTDSSHGAEGVHVGGHAHSSAPVHSSTESYGVGVGGSAGGVGHGTATAQGISAPEFHFPFFSPLAL